MISATDAERLEAERIEAEKDAIRHLYRLWAELVRAEAIPELLQMITPDAVFLPENAPPPWPAATGRGALPPEPSPVTGSSRASARRS